MSEPSPWGKILLGVTGSIAAYKSCELVRALSSRGAEVRVVMTANACHLVAEPTLECLSGNQVLTELFSCRSAQRAQHVDLSEWADLILVAPATANILGKAAAGIADDLLSATILCAPAKVLFAPAMHTSMYENAVVQRNISALRRAGCEFIGPDEGALASGGTGLGRLADTQTIVARVESILGLAG